MMQQYHEAKQAHPDTLLLFRMGDFYELFYGDAEEAARLLQLALTSRDKGENAIPMAGFPHHQLESYLKKLVQAGRRVAICEQVEDARQAKGLVKREVVRVVSPGTLTEEGLLDPLEANYLAAIVVGKEVAGLAWVELSTGEFWAMDTPLARLDDELARVAPREFLVSESCDALPGTSLREEVVTRRPEWQFSTASARECLLRHFGVASLAGFGFEEENSPGTQAAGGILQYLLETQKTSLVHIERLQLHDDRRTLQIDEATRRSLELMRTFREGKREGSLLGVLDRTTTSMGARLLASLLSQPLADREAIEARLDAVEEWVADPLLCQALRQKLRGIHDLDRLLTRISTGRASPRDLSFLAKTLACLPGLKAKLTGRKCWLLAELEGQVDLCPEIRARLEAALADPCPITAHEGGVIKPGCNSRLDELRELSSGGREWMAAYQAEESARLDMPLKVGFNKVFGYYIEITHTHRDKVPEEYHRKQTLKNAERYITPKLKEFEEQVLTAEEEARELEYQLFVELRNAAAEAAPRIRGTARALAQLDVLLSLATLALERGYCRPQLVDEPVLEIEEGRHPVLDALLPAGDFVPNDTRLDGESRRMLLITGPNMAGKSTYIRQTALLVVLAQMGSFVPARRAVVGVADRVFARVGASDELSRGQSTFMVEMTETARILNTATSRSVVILDEIGRGTSTYDGISLAWAVAEYLHDQIRCRTLFATHYHELTELEHSLEAQCNLNVAVREAKGEVAFLHRIVEGSADKSYGIHVARLAGIPRPVHHRAREILDTLESRNPRESRLPGLNATENSNAGAGNGHVQMRLFETAEHPLVRELSRINIEQTTPLEAFQLVRRWQEEWPSDDQS